MILEILQNPPTGISEYITPAIVSLITLAIALPMQAKAAQGKALETVQKVYSGMLKDVTDKVLKLEKTVKEWEEKYNNSHCENATTCKNRKK